MFMFQFISMYFKIVSIHLFMNIIVASAKPSVGILHHAFFDNYIAGELTMLEADPARPHIARAFFTHGRGKKVRALGVFI